MNYGKKGAKKRLSSLQAQSYKVKKKVNISIFKGILFCFLACILFVASIGFGVLKGIINRTSSLAKHCYSNWQ